MVMQLTKPRDLDHFDHVGDVLPLTISKEGSRGDVRFRLEVGGTEGFDITILVSYSTRKAKRCCGLPFPDLLRSQRGD